MESARAVLKKHIRERVFIRKSSTRIASLDPGRPDLDFIFDFRAVMLDPAFLDAYTTLFWERYADLGPIQVCGMETAAIPLVTAIVMKGNTLGKTINGLFMRKERKLTGLQKILEGTPTKDPVIIVDDLISSGNSIEKQQKTLANEGLSVSNVFAIIRYRNPVAYPFLQEYGVQLDSVFAMSEFDMPSAVKKDEAVPSLRSLWRFRGQKPQLEFDIPKSAPVLFEDLVIFGSDMGILWALSQKDGSTVWQHEIGFHGGQKGIWSTPAIQDGVVFFGGYDGNVYALDARTGAKKWIYRDADWVGSSPAVAEDLGLVFIGLEFGLFKKHGGIAAIRIADGAERWAVRDMPLFTHASPLSIEREHSVVVGSNDGVMHCFDARDGTPRWTFETAGPIKARCAYDARTRNMVFGSFDGNVYALDARSGKESWRYETKETIFSNPLIGGNTVYVAGHDKRLHALDVKNGAPSWTFTTSGKISASPVMALGSLWIGSNDGCLREFDPGSGKVRSYFQTTERIVNAVAVNEKTGKIFLPTHANELYCLEKTHSSDVTEKS